MVLDSLVIGSGDPESASLRQQDAKETMQTMDIPVALPVKIGKETSLQESGPNKVFQHLPWTVFLILSKEQIGNVVTCIYTVDRQKE